MPFVRVVALVVALVSNPASTSAQLLEFDPSLCSQDTGGKILVRLVSGYAFWFEPDTFMLRGGLEKPPSPTGEPEGCPGNPIVTRAVAFPIQYTEALAAKRQGSPTRIPPVQLFSIAGKSGATLLQDGDIRRHQQSKDQGDICRVSEEGVEICLSSCRQDPDHAEQCLVSGPSVFLKNDTATTGMALPGAYHEYGGRRFAYSCLRPMQTINPNINPRNCEARYEMMDGLSVSYRFDGSQIPEDHILQFDSDFRAQILAARAPEYDINR